MTAERDEMNAVGNSKSIAVLMTCFNRKEDTLRSLRALQEQQLPAGFTLQIFLTDDASTDGTGEAVRAQFPEVHIVPGTGNLYWVGGMRAAWQAAKPADFYLWLNDDAKLRPGAILNLLRVHNDLPDPRAVVVGATCDPEAGTTTYGGILRKSWYSSKLLDPTDEAQPCTTMHGNIVLVPAEVEETVGNMNGAFVHQFADADYGLRCQKQGFGVWLAPGYAGECTLNQLEDSDFNFNQSIRQRWNKLFGPKGSRPFGEWWVFVREHAPRPKLFFWIVPYVMFFVEQFRGSKFRPKWSK